MGRVGHLLDQVKRGPRKRRSKRPSWVRVFLKSVIGGSRWFTEGLECSAKWMIWLKSPPTTQGQTSSWRRCWIVNRSTHRSARSEARLAAYMAVNMNFRVPATVTSHVSDCLDWWRIVTVVGIFQIIIIRPSGTKTWFEVGAYPGHLGHEHSKKML